MSNPYPVWWDTTLTIFNKYEDPLTHIVKWYKHVCYNCFWEYTGNKITIAEVTVDTEQCICRIPKTDEFEEPFEWKTLTEEQKATKFTIAPGDIIVKGSVDDTIDEYTAGHRSNDLIKKYKSLQGCIYVERVAYAIGNGRVCEHYYVTGK